MKIKRETGWVYGQQPSKGRYRATVNQAQVRWPKYRGKMNEFQKSAFSINKLIIYMYLVFVISAGGVETFSSPYYKLQLSDFTNWKEKSEKSMLVCLLSQFSDNLFQFITILLKVEFLFILNT